MLRRYLSRDIELGTETLGAFDSVDVMNLSGYGLVLGGVVLTVIAFAAMKIEKRYKAGEGRSLWLWGRRCAERQVLSAFRLEARRRSRV